MDCYFKFNQRKNCDNNLCHLVISLTRVVDIIESFHCHLKSTAFFYVCVCIRVSVFVYVCVLLHVCLKTMYTAYIREDLPINSVLLTVGATDADVGISGQIQYSLHGSGSQDFSMDPDTGMDTV